MAQCRLFCDATQRKDYEVMKRTPSGMTECGPFCDATQRTEMVNVVKERPGQPF